LARLFTVELLPVANSQTPLLQTEDGKLTTSYAINRLKIYRLKILLLNCNSGHIS